MDWLIDRFNSFKDRDLIYSDDGLKTYSNLILQIEFYLKRFDNDNILPNSTIAIIGDYCFETIALFLALAKKKCLIVPITSKADSEINYRLEHARVEYAYTLSENNFIFSKFKDLYKKKSKNNFTQKLKSVNDSGLVLFSSGSSGKPKAMVHNLDTLIDSFKSKRVKSLNFLVFLMFDHIGGINTLLNSLAMGVAITLPKNRDPEYICKLIEQYKVNVLPTSPTFLNLILLSGANTKYDLSSLKLITYGTEPMPESLLVKINKSFPRAKLLQTYGTSETGIAQIISKSSTSNLIKFNDPNYKYRIVDNELWLRSKTQVNGYLNADNVKFTDDGWFKTGDIVEQHEDGYLRIIGRNSDMINVGGLKVLPDEVETLLLEHPLIDDCMVCSEPNPITGQIVAAQIVTKSDITVRELKKEIYSFCKDKLDTYKIPVRIKIVEKLNYSSRFKKIRRWD